MLSRGSARRRDDRGAIAVVFALTCVLLFGLAAVAVDLGNAYQRKREVQSQADVAALAAAAYLPDQAAVLAAVCRSSSLNTKVGQGNLDCSSPTAVAHASTTEADPACPGTVQTSGRPFVYFFATEASRVKVCAPQARVSFGIAGALPGVGSAIDVTASATVAMGTPGANAGMPFYGVGGSSGCDWGPEQLVDPANGQAKEGTDLPTDLAQPTPAVFRNTKIDVMTPSQIDSTVTSATVRITGQGLSQVTRVGFYRSTTLTPSKVEPAALPSSSDSTGKSVDFAVPASVLAAPGIWYVRVFETTGWSSRALPLRIGDVTLSCGSLSNAGNFGSVKIPRLDSAPANWMSNNIIRGPQAPLSLAVNTQHTSPPWTCTDGVNGAIASTVTGTPVLKSRTNCLPTDTGLTANSATAGYLTGTPQYPQGRLATRSTSTGIGADNRSCGPGRSSANRSVAGVSINNDTLTCFMTNPATPLSTITSPSYAGGPVLDPAIFSSPRFCYVPIVSTDPTKGGSLNYTITDMRPCFLTSEAESSTWNNQVFVNGASADNGLLMSSSGTHIQGLGVVFFHRSALPSVGAGFGDYIGVGDKSVQLVD